MIAQAVIFVCVVAIVYLLVLQRKRGKRNLEATARLRALRRWREVLEEDADPGESFVEYQARRTGAHRQYRPMGGRRES